MPRTRFSRSVGSLETQPVCRFLEGPAHTLLQWHSRRFVRKLAEAAFPLDEPADGLRAGPGLLPCQLLPGKARPSLPSPQNPKQGQEGTGPALS